MIDVTVMKRTVCRGETRGFALPTVMIASVVMLMVLLSGLVAASSVNVSLKTQYQQKLLKDATAAGVSFAQACLEKNGYTATWTTAPLRPNTNCAGVVASSPTCPSPGSSPLALEPACAVLETASARTTFEVMPATSTTDEIKYTVTAYLHLFRASSRVLASTRSDSSQNTVTYKNNPAASRPTKRHWFFGNRAGLDFGTSGANATVITAACTTPPCNAGEGSTAISTRAGVLQFWTDGKTIWNRNGQAMPNGVGLNANGSTTQAAAVFPVAFNETQYVVVTNNTESSVNNAGELYYSVVDMSLNSGLGDVTTKNAQVWNGVFDYSSEASTAAPKSNGKGYWIITFSPFTTHVRVFSYNSVTKTIDGVQTYNAPGTVSQYGPSAGASGFGSLNFNHDYTKLVMMAGNHCYGSCSYVNGLVRVMDFNMSTGAVTNRYAWNNYTAENNHGYSADFSPNGNFVYTSTLYPARLMRYTVGGATNDSAIKSSEASLGSAEPASPSSCTGGGQIVRAPNNKMYVANCGTGNLGVINNPDATWLGDVGWIYNGITLNSGTSSGYGLPQTVTLYTPQLTRY